MKWRVALLAVVLATPALAQQPAANDTIEDLRPKGEQFNDNLGYQELPISPVPPAPSPRPSSSSILGNCVVLPEPVSPQTITTWWSRMARAISSRRPETGNDSG